MSNWDNETVRDGLLQAIAQKADQFNPYQLEEIRHIVCHNFELGRVRRYFQINKNPSPQKYVERVCEYYLLHHPYVYALQVTQDGETWQNLRQKLWGWKKRLPFNHHTTFDDIVQESCRNINQANFPYDTDFDPWAYIILRNTTYGYYDPEAMNLIGYEEEIEPLLYKADIYIKDLVQSPEEVMLHSENLAEVYQAINKLPEKQRLFMELHYIQEKSFANIAIILDVKQNALYKLHFDALANLRKILKN